MSFFEVNGARLFGAKRGTSETALVCLHGLFLGNSSSWLFPATGTLGRSHSLYCYDMRGHGMSDAPATGYDLNSMGTDLLGMMDAWELESSVLLGHSYGALVSLYVACNHPEKVQKLVLVEPPYPLAELNEIQEFLAREPAEMLASLPTAMGVEVQGGGRRARRLIQRLQTLLEDTSILEDMVRAGEESFDKAERLDIPVLIICGENSSCRQGAHHLAGRIPNCEYKVVSGGHYLLLESPDQVMDEVGRFLNG